MSTLRTNTLEDLLQTVSVPVVDIAKKNEVSAILSRLADPTEGSNLVAYNGTDTVKDTLDTLIENQSDWLTVTTTGILSVEKGAIDPQAELVKWNNLVAEARLNKSRVYIEAGTYVLPQGLDLAAADTLWVFNPGAVIKLWDTQANDDFVVFNRPVGQVVYNLTVDANRPAQISDTFGIDNCACLVISPDSTKFFNTEIVSSPSKGFAVVSAATETSRNWTVDGFKGQDCQYQVLLVDGNNRTGFFERGTINNVQIGSTGGFGLAINDGASDIVVSNVISSVNNIISDAVFIRDAWDITLNNIVGRNGRNGVQIMSLAAPRTARRITLNNVVGELNEQSGILILAAADVNGGTVIGRNNKFAGINVQWSEGVNKCERINISNPIGYDDRGTPEQDHGLYVAGVDNSVFGRGSQTGNTVSGVNFVASANVNVEFPVTKFQSISVGAIAASSFLNVVVTWPTPMPDDNYFADAVLEVATTGLSVALGHANTRTANSCSFIVRNITSSPISAGAVTLRAKATRL